MLTDEETPWSLQAAVLLVAFLTISLPVLLNASRHRKQSGLLPPSPWRLPLVGNLHQLGRFPHRSLRSLAAAHGPVMRIHLGMVPAIVVSSADAAREVLQVQDHVFASPPSLSIPSIIFYGCTDLAFAPHGPYWSRLRKLSVNHLLSPSRVRSCAAVREQEVEVLLRRVCGGGVVRLSELLSDFAKDVAGRIVLGTRAAGDEGWRAKLDALLEEIVRMLGSFHVGDCLPWLSWLSAVDGTDARARRAFQSINRILDEIVGDAEREVQVRPPGGETHDDAFLHVLLSMMKEPPQTEGRLIDRDKVKALLVDLFGAGTETMIIVLEWAMQKLQQEVRRTKQADHNSLLMITDQDLPGMEYLRAVVKEALRLHPPAPLLLPHNSMQGRYDYDVPSNTMVIVNAWAIARDPGAWDSPEDFRPERFVAGSKVVDFRGQHFELIPFGSGRRMCPGMNLAVSTVELALANLVGRFDWELPVEDKEMDMQEAPGFAVRKKSPLRAVAVMQQSSLAQAEIKSLD
ncbi:hypothetical protein BS78_K194200 [Paspalum vaginatum]|uniref:Cytochrome P450 n=1 Tax=Paspalum vaginatum TaxID=158149 RepID=A0A9W7XDW5_9POAL|nr:hypothetical protein BS78_K194200 [Paspalum vaginatum]